MNRRAMTIRTAICLAAALTLSACGSPSAPVEKPPLEGAAIGGPFTLADKTGKAVRWSDFAGKYRIVYFGYTFCPDACPMDVSTTMRGFNLFAKDQPALAAQVQPIFITIDPARDTPARVGEFAAAFSPRLLGLTGSPEQVAAAAKAFAVPYAKGKETSGGYLMDHGRIAFLMDRDGKPLAMLPAEKQDAKAVAAELAKWVK
jgi:protein SCO1/2